MTFHELEGQRMNKGGEGIYSGAAALGMEGLCLLADPVPKETSVSQQRDPFCQWEKPCSTGIFIALIFFFIYYIVLNPNPRRVII